MARGISLHIGLNNINPEHYGTNGTLHACEADAQSMYSLAQSAGYSPEILLTEQATSEAVIAAIGDAAEELDPGDIYLLTYSGHGARVPDINGDENDRYDETWCLHNRMLIDDELYQLWGQFPDGVRILVLSDSCHSGTVLKMLLAREYAVVSAGLSVEGERSMRADINPQEILVRGLPMNRALEAYERNKELYDSIQRSTAADVKQTVQASVLLIGACQDNQVAEEYGGHGRFTASLLDVWDRGHFPGNYRTFHQLIQESIEAYQSPNYYRTGTPNPAFEAQRPFTIKAPVAVETRLFSGIG